MVRALEMDLAGGLRRSMLPLPPPHRAFSTTLPIEQRPTSTGVNLAPGLWDDGIRFENLTLTLSLSPTHSVLASCGSEA